MSFDMVAHVLTLGYAVMLAALFYFILTMRTVAPRYRISSVLSVVVMVSAALLLFVQSQNWTAAFTFDVETATYVLASEENAFNNGYRYLNWLIDVPMLLFQILFVVSLTTSKFSSIRNQFWFSGAAMILTGYVGQFYEVSNVTLWLIWGAISTAFFVHILILMRRVIQEGSQDVPPAAARLLNGIWLLFLVSWMLYPGAYLMPLAVELIGGEAAVVGRQITYTIADISSKVIYGVMLTQVAQILSEREGYVYSRLGSEESALV
jgi:bacteriorhodopsin